MVASDNGPGNLTADDRGQLSIASVAGCSFRMRFATNENIIDKNAYIGVLRLKHDLKGENTIGMLATSYISSRSIIRLAASTGVSSLISKHLHLPASWHDLAKLFLNPEEGKDEYRPGHGLGTESVTRSREKFRL